MKFKQKQNAMLSYQDIFNQLLCCKKIAIVGNQGAGKTTLAKRLAGILDIDYIESPRDRDTSPSGILELQKQMSQRNNWIIDGDFELLELADMVIFLNFPLILCYWRATKRSFLWFLSWPLSSIKIWLKIPTFHPSSEGR